MPILADLDRNGHFALQYRLDSAKVSDYSHAHVYPADDE